MSFVHLHVHTQYSILDGQSSIENLFRRAKELGMPAIAITDHGNMFGVKEFFKIANTKDKKTGEKPYADIKPIVGCEVYVTRHYDNTIKDKAHNKYYHLLLLAKNETGYKNLVKIVSDSHINGFYSRPRTTHEMIKKHSEGLICSSACMAGEIPHLILEGKIEEAEQMMLWHREIFGEDYYLEVMLHKTEVPGLSLEVWEKEKEYVEVLFELAKKHGIKVIATNDVHFVNKEDGPAHDLLLCLNQGTTVDDPDRLRYTQQEYLKSEEEMLALFPDHPEVISNTVELAEKVERYNIDKDPILPKFQLPEEFTANIDEHLAKYKDIIDVGRCNKDGSDRGVEFTWSVAYLCHLCYKGAHERYGETFTPEQAERIEFELKTICSMGFPDYFLIVQDFISAARAEGTWVGPGRGSAAGSAVAYCLHITNLDPIKYDLLFERFLNPDRINMPDIDIDFDVEGRYKAFDYIERRYGRDHISHVITFGTMAAKSAIKDVARVNKYPIEDTNNITKLIPDRPIRVMEPKEEEYKEGMAPVEGQKVFEKEVDDPDNPGQKIVKKFRSYKEEKEYKINLKNCYKYVPELKELLENGDDATKEVLKFALKLEGSIRQVGVHACAMIIGRGDLTDFIPITLTDDKEAKGEDGKPKKVWTSQYDGHFIEEVGMLKMDFLGLNTLSIMKECLKLIKQCHGEDIDIEKIPIDDPETYALYARGDTQSVFQFESPGMKEWLQKLQPTRFDDLIAMNALYRPGPMDYIPDFVDCKLGRKPITYDLPAMEEYLKDTYGVTVYQEQVMLLSRKLAGFTRGQADTLRKAMGKKIKSMLDQLYPLFIEGGQKNGHPKEILEKIWKDWEAFAKYAFNKSHATCYAWVSYQTAWLKAHYPAEFQAANLTLNISNSEEIRVIMADCKRNGIDVLSPDVNESLMKFNVNNKGQVRFGLAGIKGFGSNVAEAIINERASGGAYADIWDFVQRVPLGKKALEGLVYSGALDSFGLPRAGYFTPTENGTPFIDELVKYGEQMRKCSEDGGGLFGAIEEIMPPKPEFPVRVMDIDNMEMLKKEKDLVGMYLSSHPLDNYRFELETFTNITIDKIKDRITEDERLHRSEKIAVAGLITKCDTKNTGGGKPYASVTVEDYDGNYEHKFFGKDYERFLPYLNEHTAIYIEGEIKERYFGGKNGQEAPKNPPYALRVNNLRLLGNISEEMLAGFGIFLSTPMINAELRKKLLAIIKKNKGPIPLTINLFDPDTKYRIDMFSRKYKVSVGQPLLEGLKELGINYKAVRK